MCVSECVCVCVCVSECVCVYVCACVCVLHSHCVSCDCHMLCHLTPDPPGHAECDGPYSQRPSVGVPGQATNLNLTGTGHSSLPLVSLPCWR